MSLSNARATARHDDCEWTCMFSDRTDAGRRLARLLMKHKGTDAVVLGLPRGGVPVALEVARALGAPLDVLIVRKLGAPVQPELAMGALAEGGARYVDPRIVYEAGCSEAQLAMVEHKQKQEIARRVALWRGGRPPIDVEGKTAIVVDDGIATGGTIRAALQALRKRKPARIVVAVPVASPSAVASLHGDADEVVCLDVEAAMWSIGESYEDFTQVPDERVTEILEDKRWRQAEVTSG